MTTERALLDTNVLLAASDEARVEHEGAVAVLDAWPATGTVLYTSGQILREYLAVATRPVRNDGLGMTRGDAIGNVRALRTRATLLNEDRRVCNRLLWLLDTIDCTGKQVHDANIVATMLVHGIDTVVTINVTDFARFDDHITVVPLAT